MASLFSSKSSLSGSNTPASTRPPSYDSERLPRYSFDGALTTNPAQAAVRVITRAPLAVIDETPEVRKEKDPFAGYGGTIGLIGILLFLNGLVVASIWFITAIKLKPWNYAHIAEHKEKYLLAIWIPAVVLTAVIGPILLHTAAVIEDRKTATKKTSTRADPLSFLIFVSCLFGPFIASLAIPMAVRVNYFKHVCDGMDTRIKIDADRISLYQFRPYPIVRDTITKPYKYPMAAHIDGSANSTFNLDLTPWELDYRRYFDTYKGDTSVSTNEETYEPHGLNYSVITYDWTANTWSTFAPDGSLVNTGTFWEANEDFFAPSLGLYVPDWARVKRSNVYDAYMRVFQIPTDLSMSQIRLQQEAFKKQSFRSNHGVVARVTNFATKKNVVQMCALRRDGREVTGGPGAADGRTGLGVNLPILVCLVQGMRENEWKAGRRLVKDTVVI